MANLKLRYAGLVCVSPNLITVTNSSNEDFHLEWNYAGAVYSEATDIMVQYSTDGGVIYNDHTTQIFTYPTLVGDINIIGIPPWEVIYFRIVLSNENCNITSNEIIINIS